MNRLKTPTNLFYNASQNIRMFLPKEIWNFLNLFNFQHSYFFHILWAVNDPTIMSYQILTASTSSSVSGYSEPFQQIYMPMNYNLISCLHTVGETN